MVIWTAGLLIDTMWMMWWKGNYKGIMDVMRLSKQLESSGGASALGLSRQAEELHSLTHKHTCISQYTLSLWVEQITAMKSRTIWNGYSCHFVTVSPSCHAWPGKRLYSFVLFVQCFLIVSKLLPSFACSHLAPTARTNKYLQQIQAKRTTGNVKSDHLLMLNRQRINDLYVV